MCKRLFFHEWAKRKRKNRKATCILFSVFPNILPISKVLSKRSLWNKKWVFPNLLNSWMGLFLGSWRYSSLSVMHWSLHGNLTREWEIVGRAGEKKYIPRITKRFKITPNELWANEDVTMGIKQESSYFSVSFKMISQKWHSIVKRPLLLCRDQMSIKNIYTVLSKIVGILWLKRSSGGTTTANLTCAHTWLFIFPA